MIIDCIADLHGFQTQLPGGDLLILAGDYTASGKLNEWASFFNWLKEQPYDHKILIAGNHDNLFESVFSKKQKQVDSVKEIIEYLDIDVDFEYLCDSGTKYKGFKIWGSPWTVWFKDVNPKCKCFMKRESYLQKKFEKIPLDTDILITHSPPYLILDKNIEGIPCGSIQLRQQLDTQLCPRFHIFGHIHEKGGCQMIRKHVDKNTVFINCSYVNERYKPVNNFMRLEI